MTLYTTYNLSAATACGHVHTSLKAAVACIRRSHGATAAAVAIRNMAARAVPNKHFIYQIKLEPLTAADRATLGSMHARNMANSP